MNRMLVIFSLVFFSGFVHAYVAIPKLCRSVYDRREDLQKEISLQLFKNKIFEIASHPEFQKDDFDFNATGPRLRFLHPLIEHMILKTARELESIGHLPDLEKFNIAKEKWLEDLKYDRMSYLAMLKLPTQLSTYLQSSIWKTDVSDYDAKLPALFNQSAKNRFEKQRIFPIPMFFTPDFELRTRLWAIGKPMISVVKDKFYSHLDETTFAILENPEHDWNHAIAEVGGFATSSEKPLPVKSRRAGNQALVTYAENLPAFKRKIAFFFLHQLIPEGSLLYSESSRRMLADKMKETLNRYFLQRMVPTWSSVKVSKLEWILESLNLVGVRIETSKGNFVRFDRRESDGAVVLVEGTFDQYKDYMIQLVNEFTGGMEKALNEALAAK